MSRVRTGTLRSQLSTGSGEDAAGRRERGAVFSVLVQSTFLLSARPPPTNQQSGKKQNAGHPWSAAEGAPASERSRVCTGGKVDPRSAPTLS